MYPRTPKKSNIAPDKGRTSRNVFARHDQGGKSRFLKASTLRIELCLRDSESLRNAFPRNLKHCEIGLQDTGSIAKAVSEKPDTLRNVFAGCQEIKHVACLRDTGNVSKRISKEPEIVKHVCEEPRDGVGGEGGFNEEAILQFRAS